jgi:hypothetical protein
MIKNILLIVMTVFSLLCFGYAYVQKLDADKQRELAVTNQMKAEQATIEAVKAGDMARAAQAEADQQRALAIECGKNAKK